MPRLYCLDRPIVEAKPPILRNDPASIASSNPDALKMSASTESSRTPRRPVLTGQILVNPLTRVELWLCFKLACHL